MASAVKEVGRELNVVLLTRSWILLTLSWFMIICLHSSNFMNCSKEGRQIIDIILYFLKIEQSKLMFYLRWNNNFRMTSCNGWLSNHFPAEKLWKWRWAMMGNSGIVTTVTLWYSGFEGAEWFYGLQLGLLSYSPQWDRIKESAY